jgi:phenylalanyl-tRNA synthetase alpha chain
MGIFEELGSLKETTLERVAESDTLGALDQVRVDVLGKKGTLTGILRGLGALTAEERPMVGKVSNEVRSEIEAAIDARRSELADAERARKVASSAVDVTLPGRRRLPGRQHLISQIVDEVVDIFVGLGYMVAEGPEVELDYYNFTALNHPPTHPARSTTDTFYVRDLSDESAPGPLTDVLLRTHTSPVQVRVLEKQKPPVYVICPGRVYRRDIADPSHLPQFHQIEGLAVDEGITFGDLKGSLDYVCKELFGHGS